MASPARKAVDGWKRGETTDADLVTFLSRLDYATPTDAVSPPGYFDEHTVFPEDGTWAEVVGMFHVNELPDHIFLKVSENLYMRHAGTP